MGILRNMHSIKSTSSNCAHRFPRYPACWCTLIRGGSAPLGTTVCRPRWSTNSTNTASNNPTQSVCPARLLKQRFLCSSGCGFLAAWRQTRGFADTVTDLDNWLTSHVRMTDLTVANLTQVHALSLKSTIPCIDAVASVNQSRTGLSLHLLLLTTAEDVQWPPLLTDTTKQLGTVKDGPNLCYQLPHEIFRSSVNNPRQSRKTPTTKGKLL